MKFGQIYVSTSVLLTIAIKHIIQIFSDKRLCNILWLDLLSLFKCGTLWFIWFVDLGFIILFKNVIVLKLIRVKICKFWMDHFVNDMENKWTSMNACLIIFISYAFFGAHSNIIVVKGGFKFLSIWIIWRLLLRLWVNGNLKRFWINLEVKSLVYDLFNQCLDNKINTFMGKEWNMFFHLTLSITYFIDQQ